MPRSPEWKDVEFIARQGSAVLSARSHDDAREVLWGMLAWFDDHPEADAMLLTLDDRPLGAISRSQLLDLLPDPERAADDFGSSARLELPGIPTDFRTFRFSCPEPDCMRQVIVVRLVPGAPLLCPEHGVPLERVDR